MKLLAALVLAIHLAWILWVITGALFTRGRPWLAGVHLASLVWGIIVEAGPWPCPLTLAEQALEARAGIQPYSGGFLVHSLDAIVYPDLPAGLVIGFGIAVCCGNLLIYLFRFARALRRRRSVS
jgi:Protein of Unknown function (DUF2784)